MTIRKQIIDLFAIGVAAADPERAIANAFSRQPPCQPDHGGTRVLIAVGKAAVPMARASMLWFGAETCIALVVTNAENAGELSGAQVLISGHPIPDQAGIAAGEAVIDRLKNARAADRVIMLISGGGSALLPAPVEEIDLEMKQAVNQLMLAVGMPIQEINLVRQSLSRLKGGRALEWAHPAPVQAYILSDVIGDDLRVIASGPTAPALGTRGDAVRLLRDRGIWEPLPQAVQDFLQDPQPPMRDRSAVENHLIGSNRQSLQAICTALGGQGWILRDDLTGDVGAAASLIADVALGAAKGAQWLILGGETTVTLRGAGSGGRNQELALRVAMALQGLARTWVFLSAGTDGRDGPTDAAGGVVDNGTIDRIRAAGLDPEQMLAQNDSNPALAASGDLVITGGTRTNVADIQLLWLG